MFISFWENALFHNIFVHDICNKRRQVQVGMIRKCYKCDILSYYKNAFLVYSLFLWEGCLPPWAKFTPSDLSRCWLPYTTRQTNSDSSPTLVHTARPFPVRSASMLFYSKLQEWQWGAGTDRAKAHKEIYPPNRTKKMDRQTIPAARQCSLPI